MPKNRLTIKKEQHHIPIDINHQSLLLEKKIQLTSYHFLIITPDQSIIGIEKLDDELKTDVDDLKNAWKIIRGVGLTDLEKQKMAWKQIDDIGDRLPGHERRSSLILRHFKKSKDNNLFFILLPEKDSDIFPQYELSVLCNLWQVEHKRIPIHSVGVTHHRKLFLFGGPSGAGKSTVANLSVSQGDWVLDEDQLLLNQTASGRYNAQAWGYSLQNTDIPLAAVFKLVKDDSNRLIPLTATQTASFLFERVMEVMGFMFEKRYIRYVFSEVTSIARSIPGYELHFTKSPDFWELIDAEFSLN